MLLFIFAFTPDYIIASVKLNLSCRNPKVGNWQFAVLFSYAAHPVTVHATSTEFSADFPGYATRYIQSKYPRSIPLFLQGCAGNVNSTLRGGYEAAEMDGNKSGEAVINSAVSLKKINPSPVLYGQHNFCLPFMDFAMGKIP